MQEEYLENLIEDTKPRLKSILLNVIFLLPFSFFSSNVTYTYI